MPESVFAYRLPDVIRRVGHGTAEFSEARDVQECGKGGFERLALEHRRIFWIGTIRVDLFLTTASENMDNHNDPDFVSLAISS